MFETGEVGLVDDGQVVSIQVTEKKKQNKEK